MTVQKLFRRETSIYTVLYVLISSYASTGTYLRIVSNNIHVLIKTLRENMRTDFFMQKMILNAYCIVHIVA